MEQITKKKNRYPWLSRLERKLEEKGPVEEKEKDK